jgi:hypothetical protein
MNSCRLNISNASIASQQRAEFEAWKLARFTEDVRTRAGRRRMVRRRLVFNVSSIGDSSRGAALLSPADRLAPAPWWPACNTLRKSKMGDTQKPPKSRKAAISEDRIGAAYSRS